MNGKGELPLILTFLLVTRGMVATDPSQEPSLENLSRVMMIITLECLCYRQPIKESLGEALITTCRGLAEEESSLGL